MAINERKYWPKWIWASVAEHMRPVALGLSIPLLTEGIDDRQDSKVEASHAELRINGPFIYEVNNDWYQVLVPINVLLMDYMIGDDANSYRMQEWAGKFMEVMDDPIPIYRYGQTAVVDDGSYLGCLRVKRTKDGGVRVVHFGQVGRTGTVDVLIRESAVDALFEMYLKPTK
jgi:hypothetical protein